MNKKAISYRLSAVGKKPEAACGFAILSPSPWGEGRGEGICAVELKSYSIHPRAFTLTELLIAIAVLIVVILATSRIFATASQVTGIGQATSDVLTEAAAIERNLRDDIENLSYEGVFAIRNVSIRNDINFPAGLLNPELPPDARLRCDQLVFFGKGVEGAVSSRMSSGGDSKAQSTETFVYYGHAFQIPGARPFQITGNNVGRAHDPAPLAKVYPWTAGNIAMANTTFGTVGSTGGDTSAGNFGSAAAGNFPIAQPGARQWLLAREVAILCDDDSDPAHLNSKTVYMARVLSARSVFLNNAAITGMGNAFLSPQLRDGRVDAAATQLGAVRQRIQFAGANWQTQQRPYILNNLVNYPRAERVAPSNHRIDQALTNHVLSSSCSSITIEWTYDLGVGAATAVNPYTGNFTDYLGVSNAGTSLPSAAYEPVGEIRWFGLPDDSRGVYPYSYSGNQWPDGWTGHAQTIDPANIEAFSNNLPNYAEVNYVFGFNQDRPFLHPATGLPDRSFGSVDTSAIYTPWPSALRITMVLHDPAAKLEGGRTFQFIVRLPARNP